MAIPGDNTRPADLVPWEFRSDADIRTFTRTAASLASAFANVGYMTAADLEAALRDVPSHSLWRGLSSATRARRVANIARHASALQVASMREWGRVWTAFQIEFLPEREAARRKTKRSAFQVTGGN